MTFSTCYPKFSMEGFKEGVNKLPDVKKKKKIVNGGVGVRNQMFDSKAYDINHHSNKANCF